jgi:hypothetical protein
MQYPTIAQPQYAFAPTMMAEGGKVQAENVRAQGRGEDTMLVHMTPGEVGGLQALAMQHGGSLSINPNTGMPEAGFLKNLLPTLLGVALTPFMGPMGAAMTVGGIETVRTGDLGKGLMAGLGAYGGANIGSSLGSMGASSAPGVVAPSAAPVSVASDLAGKGVYASGPLTATAPTSVGQVGTSVLPSGSTVQSVMTPSGDISMVGAGSPADTASVISGARPTYAQMGQGIQDLFTKEGAFKDFIGKQEVKADPQKGIQAVRATGLGGDTEALKTAGMAAAPLLFATPEYARPAQEEEEPYEGPYTPTRRTVSYPGEEQRRRTSEFMYFSPSNPVPFAEGGDVSSGLSMTAPEAQVYSQIANVQQLAGLPAIDTSRFNIIPSIPSVAERVGLVYNPIDGSYIGPGAGGGTETNYGFESLSSHIPQGGMPTTNVNPGNVKFYRPVTDGRVFLPFNKDPSQDVEGYRERYEEYTPGRNLSIGAFGLYNTTPNYRVNMLDFAYDPYLGGYVKIAPNESPWGGAKGGSVPQLESGGFVLTKKAVDGLGKGDNKRGQEVASRGLGAIPIKGPGTGTSDSIKTTIDGKVPARIANGEAYVPKKQVAKNGGAKKFYALMKKAERRA